MQNHNPDQLVSLKAFWLVSLGVWPELLNPLQFSLIKNSGSCFQLERRGCTLLLAAPLCCSCILRSGQSRFSVPGYDNKQSILCAKKSLVQWKQWDNQARPGAGRGPSLLPMASDNSTDHASGRIAPPAVDCHNIPILFSEFPCSEVK